MNLILEHTPVDIKAEYCNQYSADFDRLIKFGTLAYDPNSNQTVDTFSPGASVGLFTISTSVFSQFQQSHGKIFPVYPLLTRAFTNDVSKNVYNTIRDLYHQCKENVTQEYNTVLFNIGRGSIFRHKHQYAAPDGVPVITQVFAIRLTDFTEPNLEFRVYHSPKLDTYESRSLNQNCMMRFNGLRVHEVIATNDDNYYGYFVFEKWHE